MATPTFTKTGAKATVAKTLPKDIFALEVTNHELIKKAYVTYLSNGRQNLAVTKKRGEVSGGGKKPWRQKGTGRARFGSSRNPIWRGGGIAFGPTGQENYHKDLSTTSKRQAIRQALSLKNSAGLVSVIEDIDLKNGKTSDVVKLLAKMEAKGRVLIVVHELDSSVKRATSNLQNVMVVRADRINVYDVINADCIIVTEKSVEAITGWLGKKSVKKEEV